MEEIIARFHASVSTNGNSWSGKGRKRGTAACNDNFPRSPGNTLPLHDFRRANARVMGLSKHRQNDISIITRTDHEAEEGLGLRTNQRTREREGER